MTRYTINGESSPQVWESLYAVPWPQEVKDRWMALLVDAREHWLDGPLASVNYNEPRLYLNEYDMGTNGIAALSYVIGRKVYHHEWKLEEKT